MTVVNERQTPEFIDSGNIPVYDVHGLHDMEVIGSQSWFLLCDQRRTVEGKIYLEPAFYVRMPNESVGPGILVTMRKAAHVIAVPIREKMRELLRRLGLH
jgi:hypothetical protein